MQRRATRPFLALALGSLALLACAGDGGMRARAELAAGGGPAALEGASILSEESTMETRKAMFGAGCFWGVEAAFRKKEGVVATAVGYSGGEVEAPSYELVCSDTTGHAEVVEVEFDPTVVSYRELVELFFEIHDPTTMNRQGPDVGSQYRSAIFHLDEEQRQTAEATKARLDDSGRFGRPIVTEISEALPFYRAEEYHQQYLAKRGRDSCATTIRQ